MIKFENNVFENKQYVSLFTKINDLDLHITDAFRINRLVKKLDELSTEYTGLRKTLNDKYGTLDGDIVKIEKDNVEQYTKELGELLVIEHELDIELLPLPKGMEENISATEIDIVEKFFDLSSLN